MINRDKMTQNELLAELELGKEIKCKFRGDTGILRYRTSNSATLEITGGKRSVFLVALGQSLIQFKDLEIEI